MGDITLLLFSLTVFAAIATISYVALSAYASHVQVRQRLKTTGSFDLGGASSSSLPFANLAAVNERLFSTTPAKVTQLRLELQRAGFFADKAPQLFLLIRTAAMLYIPLVGYLAIQFLLPSFTSDETLLAVIILLFIAYVAPGAILDRLKARQMADYKTAFPDLLDMLVVCVDAGLSFEGALQRLSVQFVARSRNLGYNLQILSSELRAGRSGTEALDGLADRLGLDEARSFATLLKQSLELGSDIGSALRVYSDEMREKRAAAAEEKANRLPVVMVIPLGLFIFPVLMVVIVFPAGVKIADALKSFMGG